MAWPRIAIVPTCAFATILACSSRSRGEGTPDTGDLEAATVVCSASAEASSPPCPCPPQSEAQADAQTCPASSASDGWCLCVGQGPVEADDAGAGFDAGVATETDVAAQSAAISAAAVVPFLGTWTLVGTEQYVCAAETSDSLPESATMTLRSGPGATDSGVVDLLFDGGLGCTLAMSVTGGTARLVFAPQTCGVVGKPIDRVFSSVEITPSTQFAAWLRLEETFTEPSGCAFFVQGYLLP